MTGGGRRAAIEDFLVAYGHTIDDGGIAHWPDFFTEDGLYRITTRENHDAGLPMAIFSCQGKGMMADRVLALETANIFEPHSYCHLLGPPQFGEESADGQAVRSNFNIIRTMQDGGSASFAVGKYLDRIVFEDERPLFKERLVVLDSRRIDILLVLPL